MTESKHPTLDEVKEFKPQWAGRHFWMSHGGMISCAFCTFIQRGDRTEAPCKGPVRLRSVELPLAELKNNQELPDGKE